MLVISTECDDDPDALMARLVDHGRAGGDPDSYFREFTAPAGCELTDRGAWAAANPMLGDTLDPAHLAALVKTTRESRFRRFHLNQRMSLDGAWLPPGAWDACRQPFTIPDGVEVVLGFDGSFNGDTTALVVVAVDRERPHIELVELWEPTGGQVPIMVVEDAIRSSASEVPLGGRLACVPHEGRLTVSLLIPVHIDATWRNRNLFEGAQRLIQRCMASG